jgi:hypothetical protein
VSLPATTAYCLSGESASAEYGLGDLSPNDATTALFGAVTPTLSVAAEPEDAVDDVLNWRDEMLLLLLSSALLLLASLLPLLLLPDEVLAVARGITTILFLLSLLEEWIVLQHQQHPDRIFSLH